MPGDPVENYTWIGERARHAYVNGDEEEKCKTQNRGERYPNHTCSTLKETRLAKSLFTQSL